MRSVMADLRQASDGANSDPTEYIMNHRKLMSISRMPPFELLQLIVQKKKGFLRLLQSHDLSFEVLSLVIHIICRACESHVIPKSRLKFLHEVLKSGFLISTLSGYISSVHQEYPEIPSDSVSIQDLLSSCVCLLEHMLRSFPSSLPEVMVVFASLDMYCKDREFESNTDHSDLHQKVENLQQFMDEMTKKYQKYKTRSKYSSEDQQKPPNDFREMSIFPQMNDIYLYEKPFLRVNKDTGGYQDLDHYLDVQFRLLREDFVSPLREGIYEFAEAQKAGENNEHRRDREIRLYSDVHVKHSICTEDSGLIHCIQFDAKPLKQVKWETSKRLIYGSLLCLSSDNFQSILFATVVQREPEKLKKGILYVKFEREEFMGDTIAPEELFVMAESSAFFEAYKHVLSGMQQITDDLPFQKYIVHCETKVQPPRYLRRNMVNYDFSPIMPQQESVTTHKDNHDVKRMSSDKLKSTEENKFEIPVLNFCKWPTAEELMVDNSQMEAIKASLTKEFVVIQGPPGTGKTHIGLKVSQILLANKIHWSRENKHPMLIVCYTNHALDQFLEGVVRYHPSNVVRIGGRSQNEELDRKCNIRYLRFKQKWRDSVPVLVQQGINEGRKEIKNLEKKLTQKIAALKATYLGVLNEAKLKNFISKRQFKELTEHVPLEFRQLQQKKFKSMILEWLGLGSVGNMIPEQVTDTTSIEENEATEGEEGNKVAEDVMSVDKRMLNDEHHEEAREKYDLIPPDMDGLDLTAAQLNVPYKDIDKDLVWLFDVKEMEQRSQWLKKELSETTKEYLNSSIWKLHMEDRWKLYRFWVHEYRLEIEEGIRDTEQEYAIERERLLELKQQKDLAIMREADVISMTTTGAARYWHILQQIQPKIIIVEEAAEVLESHIVTTLSPGCEHLILIGDHKQLRPNPAVYQLAKRYNLDLSLFERMVNNGMQCNMLEIQHRMRPEIAALISPIYPDLKNHDSVEKYDNINGVEKNMFFIDHKEQETNNNDNKSHSNDHEAKYITALCKYLLQQGYCPEKITVLTTYSGQLFTLKNLMSKSEFHGVHLCVVDSYQGEENDIVLLSLVRSNKNNSIGFLSIENRVCVALSRAKKGFYIIGNLTLLANKTDLWSEILKILRGRDCVGKFLELYCLNHPSRKIHVGTSVDFPSEGGCSEPCEFRLDCGHVCTKTCHILDSDHTKYKCTKQCLHRCEKGHQCSNKCSEACGKCTFLVQKECPKCTFSHSVPCYFDFKEGEPKYGKYKCKKPCGKILCSLDHKCPKKCYETCDKCIVKVPKEDPRCHHTNLVPCYFKFENPDQKFKYKCMQLCTKTCNSGHLCQKECWEECECKVMVEKNCPKCHASLLVPCNFYFLENDKEYTNYRCTKLCKKTLCDQGHKCQRECWEECDRSCSQIVVKKNPFCQHSYQVPCNFVFPQAQKDSIEVFLCQVMVDKENTRCHHIYKVPCYFEFFSTMIKGKKMKFNKCQILCGKLLCESGHRCEKKCFESSGDCMVIVQKENPKCHHMNVLPCSISFESNPCKAKCPKILECGHNCMALCGNACTEQCQTEVERDLACGHIGKFKCYINATERNCTKPCEKTLECGHKCMELCNKPCTNHCKEIVEKVLPCDHTVKTECHRDLTRMICTDKCTKILDCGHKCMELCNKPCTNHCQEIVEKVLPCDHTVKTECHRDLTRMICADKCTKILDCGHECVESCGKACTKECKVQVNKTLACGHSMKLDCHVIPWDAKCNNICKAVLKCGHECSGICDDCLNVNIHTPCMEACRQTLICGHLCQAPCSMICPPCQEVCQTSCSHGNCKLRCASVCLPCLMPCDWRCPHNQCRLPCSVPCQREPCEEPCSKSLKCNHPCIGLCGEKCPDLCTICDKDKIENILELNKKCDPQTARFVQLQDCEHIFEVNYLDNWIKGNDDQTIHLKTCPTCSTPIRTSSRYGRYIKTFQNDLRFVKQKMRTSSLNPGKVKRKLLEEVYQLRREEQATVHMNWLYTCLHGKILAPKTIDMYSEILHLLKCMIRLLQMLEFREIKSVGSLTKDDIIVSVYLLTEWCKRDRTFLVEEELDEAKNEVSRLWCLSKLMLLRQSTNQQNSEISVQMMKITEAIVELKEGKYDDTMKQKCASILEELKVIFPNSEVWRYQKILPTLPLVPSITAFTKEQWIKCEHGSVYSSFLQKEDSPCRRCRQISNIKRGINSETADSRQTDANFQGSSGICIQNESMDTKLYLNKQQQRMKQDQIPQEGDMLDAERDIGKDKYIQQSGARPKERIGTSRSNSTQVGLQNSKKVRVPKDLIHSSKQDVMMQPPKQRSGPPKVMECEEMLIKPTGTTTSASNNQSRNQRRRQRQRQRARKQNNQ